ncbi:hypothetical protein [Hydrogenivirga sp. 128-5-R1-1]|uniref:hypothetical protein n=1 Tax=Hydrogenivirga sp. 128-5-R1-1 TaxID=392423 RepID=UPI00015F3862|nr:hypothetical protein [Hydrogenivirga sp. 128-5-R1-1]EDP76513.1 hypothetical protein HG1285_02863 [Hydrogenivirga sp. 128-5-R1-1]
MGSYLILLSVASFLSISVYEGLVILGILIFLLRGGMAFRGSLRIPLSGYVLSTLVPTALFFPKMFVKSVSEGLFQVIYFLNPERTGKTLVKLNYIFVLLGLLGLPVLLYNVTKTNTYKLFWGGHFEVASFYTLFAFASLLIATYLYLQGKKFNFGVFFYVLLALSFFAVVVFSARRSYLLSIPVVFLALSYLMYRSKLLKGRYVVLLLVFILLGGSVAYVFLSTKDVRFKVLNEVVLGKRKLDTNALNIISSSRLNIMLDGIKIIESDIKEGRYVNLLLGHGIRSGLYLPHEKSPKSWQRYESIILVSETIERGIIGLVSILLIYFIAFREFLRSRVSGGEEVLYLMGMIPLLVHLVASVFTFFWDALLPLYLLMFKFGEKALRERA